MSTHVGRHVSCLATYSACERRSRKRPARRPAPGFWFCFRVSTATLPISECFTFYRLECHRPTRKRSTAMGISHQFMCKLLRAPTNSSSPRTPSARHTDGAPSRFRPSHRCRGSRRARRVRRAAPPVAAPSFAARSPRASRAAPTPTPSRHTRRRDGRRRSRQRCGAKIAEPRGPTGASMSCSCRCVRVPDPVPSTTTTTTTAASRDPDPNARENPRSSRRPPARPKTRAARRTKIT